MIQVEKSVKINRPLPEVFAFVSNTYNVPKWQGGVENVYLEGPVGNVGTKFTEVRRFMGQEMKSTLEITAFEQNARWAARVIKGPVPYEVSATFEDAGGGGTKMTTRVEGEPKGFFKIAEGMLKGQLEKSLEEDGQRLKGILEGA